MMKSNYLRLADVARVAKRFGAPLRVNVYQAVRSDLYALTYEEYWQGFQHLFERTDVIAISEPLVSASDGRPGTARWGVWRQHGASYAARHNAALRVLAWHRRAAVRADFVWDRDSQLRAISAGSYTPRSLWVLRVSRTMSWGMCRTAAFTRGGFTAGFLLSDHSRRAATPRDPHGRESRSA